MSVEEMIRALSDEHALGVWIEPDFAEAIQSRLGSLSAKVEELSETVRRQAERLRAAEELAKLLAYYESELSHELLDALANYRAAGGLSLDKPAPGGGDE